MSKARDIASRSGLIQVVPTSVTVGSGSASVSGSGTVTFTSAGQASLNGVFNSNYDNYKIIVRITGGGDQSFRLRSSGSDASGASDYRNARFWVPDSAAWSANNNADSNHYLGNFSLSNITTTSSFAIEVFAPALASKTFISSHVMRGGDNLGFWTQSRHELTNSYDGFTIANGTINGTISVYGYSKS